MATELMHRIIQAYSRIHPSMYYFMEWRISVANAEKLAKEMSTEMKTSTMAWTMFGMPIEFTDNDHEILLVMRV